MAAIHETAYPRIKSNLTKKELVEIFKPTEEELNLLDANTKKTLHKTRLGFMMLLKCYQYLGRIVTVSKVDKPIKKYICEQLGIDTNIDLSDYDYSAKKRHIKIIRKFLHINQDNKERKIIMKKAAFTTASSKGNLADIINYIIDELIKSRFELPGYHLLLRLARAARTVVNNNAYEKITGELSEKQKKLIDGITRLTESDQSNPDLLSWTLLKLESKKPTTNNIREYIQYVNRMCDLLEQLDVNVDFIAPTRLEQLRDEALAADSDDIQSMREVKRYALVCIFIHIKTASAIDDLVKVLITWSKKIEASAKKKLKEYRIANADQTDRLVLQFYHTLLIVKNQDGQADKIRAIEKQLDGKTDLFINQCEEHLGLTEDDHIQWMLKPYNNKRHLFFKLLDALTISSSNQDKGIENAIQFIKQHQSTHEEWINLDEDDAVQPDLILLSNAMFKVVTGLKREKNTIVKRIHRHYYELAVFSVLALDLNCGDAFVEGGYIYDDPNKQYVSWDEFHRGLDDFCDIIKVPKNPSKYIQYLKNKLRATAKIVDDYYPENPYLVIDKGSPILKKLTKKKEHPDLDKMRQLLEEEMPQKSIVDVIVDVENWLRLSVHFKPHSGYESKIANYPPRFVATSLAYGCNMGPTQAERSILQFTRKQIALLFNHHVTDQKLIKVIQELINSYNGFDLPKKWGAGDSASVDGTFWDMYKQNLLAAHHIRYGRYGGVGYYHVSDQYIALFSNFISCGSHESIYLLDGVVNNDSDIKINKVHGDSWAQSEVLFGISPLLGVAIMPRIKHFKHLHYYKASPDDYYDNINELFTHKPIDWELIETHYHDMLRVAMSIQKGKIKASTVLRRLCSKSRKNKLYYAFRELGRVERTVFLLNYIHDPELRRTIQAATCKSEEFNQFVAWIRFGGGGVISDNMRPNQKKIIRFNHLLANMIIFHNVVYQTKAINKLRSQGIEIPDEVLAGISPYWTEHINRFGIFQLEMEKKVAEIEYDLVAEGVPVEI